MAKAEEGQQLMITVNNRVGALSEVTEVISSQGINLVAACAYAVDNKGVIMFVSDNNKAAKKSLKAKKYDVREEPVVILTVDNKPGAMLDVTKRISDAGIDVNLIYGSVNKEGKTSRLILVSDNNAAVMMAVGI